MRRARRNGAPPRRSPSAWGWIDRGAPDLNPAELLWSYLKYGRLANFAPDTVETAITAPVGPTARAG